MPKVLCFLPKAGLANQLFVIASAELYANKYRLNVFYINKWQFKIGPYIRREKNKRNYFGFFRFQKLSLQYLLIWIKLKNHTSIIYDPKLVNFSSSKSLVIFKSLPHWSSYFDDYIPYRGLVNKLIYKQLSNKIQKQIDELPIIDVAIHVRLGDFQKLKEGTDFKNVGATRTPFDYFTNEIRKIKIDHPEYKFQIFSDGHPEELVPLTKLSNVFLFKSINDLVDLYQMSKSKILITSAGSTYSYWAGFLGECEVIQHPDHLIKIK